MFRATKIAVLISNGFPQGLITLTGEFVEEEGMWTGICLELGTVACAESLGQAQQELGEAIELQLNEMSKLGHTTEYLKQMGVPLLVLPGKIRPQGRGQSTAAPKVEWGMAEAAV